MTDWQYEFITLALQVNALRFGEFTLKSGRLSPYFFNIGHFNNGDSIAKLGKFYATLLEQSKIEYDCIFGPAYKGIPLVNATVISLANDYGKSVPFCFNRKEVKQHGEGGQLIGAPLQGKVIIIDDVITAGTAIHESMKLLNSQNATLTGVMIALDRQERGQGNESTIIEIQKLYNAPVISIITFNDLIEYLSHKPGNESILHKMQEYRLQYSV